MFVIRDFDDRGNNREKYKDLIHKDITKLWDEIYKPEQYKDTKAEEFFDFEFIMMPHKIYQEEQFFKKGEELRNRFQVGAENALYLNNDSKNVPIDGLSEVPKYVPVPQAYNPGNPD